MANILVVDGDATTRAAVRVLLEDAGHEVAQAKDGEDALKNMGRRVPDLVITELYLEGMEGMDGIHFLGRVREIWPSEPVLVMLSQARPGRSSNIGVFRPRDSFSKRVPMLRGATGFLDKPIMERELCEAVGAILGTQGACVAYE